MVKVQSIIEFMEKLAPVNLKEDFDNVGLMVGSREKCVNKVLLALDCTIDIVEEAKALEVDLIITHHPLIFKKLSNVNTDTIQGRKVIELIKNDISLYSSHTNLDSVKNGLNQKITEILGFYESEILETNKSDMNSGLGRIVKLDKKFELPDIVELVREKLNIESMKVVDGKNEITKIAIINGSGQSFINKAIAKGANCIVTGDTTYHFASDCKELGVSLIDIGHFSSEWITFIESINSIEKEFENIEFIISKRCEDPYKFI